MALKDTSYLTDLEIDKLSQFAEDPEMVEAVKKVLLDTVYNQGVLKKGQKADPLHNFALVFTSQHLDADDETIGRHQRALFQGINFVEKGFGEISNFKRQPLPPVKVQNKAR